MRSYLRRLGSGALATGVILAGTLLVSSPAQAAAPLRYEATSAFNDVASKSVTVHCPNGKVAIGVGGQINNGNGGVLLTGVVPDDTLGSVTAYATARAGYQNWWSLTVVALCKVPGDISPERVVAVGLGASAGAQCPAGKIVFGSGFLVPRPQDDSFVDQVLPSIDLSRLDVHTRGHVGVFNLFAIAICGNLQQVYYRTRGSSSLDGEPVKEAVAAGEPVDYRWTVGAGAVINGSGDLFIDALTPTVTLADAWARAVKAQPALRMAIAPAAARVLAEDEDWSVTTYGSYIGSWYAMPE